MEHSQRFSSFSVRSALARLSLGATLLFACLSAQAGTLTLNDFWLTWTPGTTPEAGGGAIVHYDDGSLTWNQSFQVNVAKFVTAVNDTTQGVNNWITPVAGSGYTFAPVDLYGIFNESRGLYKTSMGFGQMGNLTPAQFDSGELVFFKEYAQWDVTRVDTPTSNIPEPGTIALLSIALIGGLSAVRKNRKNAGPGTNPQG